MIRLRSVVRNLGLAILTTFVVSSPLAAQPGAPVPPAPPAPPAAAPPAAAPLPPRPPRAPRPPRPGKIQLPPDVRAQVEADMDRARADIDRALAEIDRNPHIPAHLKSKLQAKLRKLRSADLDELIQMAGEMDEFGREMQEWGEELQGEIQEEVQRALKYKLKAKAKAKGQDHDHDYDFDFDFDFDQDDDDAHGNDFDPWAGTAPVPPPPPGRMGRLPPPPPGPVILDLGDDFALDVDIDDLQLAPGQRAELKRIHGAEKAAVAPAAQKLDQLSRELRRELENDDTTEAEINRLVDEISRQESAVRKARLSSLVKTRKLLSNAQRSKVDGRTR